MKLSILGLGYVGAVSSACFAKMGHTVYGVDTNQVKVDLIKQGKSPIVEEGLDVLIEEAIGSKCLTATTDLNHAVLNSEISIICVGTPSLPNGNINLDYIFRICEEIAGVLKNKSSFHTVVIRSTVPPGTIQECSKRIENISGKKLNVDFGMASNPEFLREGSAIRDFQEPPYTIIGATCKKSETELQGLYKEIQAPVHLLRPEESEMIKYANNNFHAMKVTFANEIGNICKELKIDGHRVMDLVAKDTKLNLSPYYLKPGFAFGGSCLPKDVRALTYKANALDLKTPLLNSLMTSNDYQVQRVLQIIYGLKKKKIGVLGFAFKPGTDDLRESPIVTLIETLIGKGFELELFDQNVMVSKLLGKNREYIDSHIPHLAELMKNDMKEVILRSDIILIGNKTKSFMEVFNIAGPEKTIIDLVRLDPAKTSSGNYVGICW